jgi:carbamoyl-phosphate synthase/aspartate carbamoyltransferase/dihydroorotase
MSRVLTIPAPVDPHVHLRGLTWAHKGDFASETAAAVAGGYWAVFDMPNTPPSTITPEALVHKLDAFTAQSVCDWGVYYGAANGSNWRTYDAVAGRVCGLKIFNNATTGDLLISDQAVRAQHYAHWTSPKPISVHAEGETVLELLALVRQYRRRTHFLHISTAEEIRYLTAAKEEGLPVTIGVCPHHLWLTEADIATLGGFGRMKPELKTAADRDALWAALQGGIVDVIESDHAPHTVEEKRAPTAPSGVPGLETTLPLLLTAVHEGRLTEAQVIALVSENPRRIWGLDAPPDTFTEVDLDAAYTLENGRLHTACGWTPFDGLRVQGKVIRTRIRGVDVYDGERVLAAPGYGKNLYA